MPLTLLADAIAAEGLDLYLVPMADEFGSEYIPPSAARLPYLTGFTGSAGFGAFWAKPNDTHRHSLFVDGRYTLQAAREIGERPIALVHSSEVSFAQWLEGQGEDLRIGFDPWLTPEAQRDAWEKAFPRHRWQAVATNLVDRIWTDRPAPPSGAIHLHPLSHAGKSYAEKREALLASLSKHGAESVLLATPDSVNWLMNLRGTDIDYNPLLLAQAVLRADGSATLFVHPHPVTPELQAYLAAERITLAPLAAVMEGTLDAALFGARMLVDASSTAVGWFALAARLGVAPVRAEDPTALPKACKNAIERTDIHDAHRRDGVALARFLHWFDRETGSGHYPDELEIVASLESFRAQDDAYRGPSFATIAGAGEHGAIVHYRADATSNRRTRAGELLLLDSGGQYAGGTTDVTRTIFVGAPTGGTAAPAIKAHVTRVLKGHIALAAARFPRGTTGSQLDVLARQYLWAEGLDYDHGTGHGVGAYLSVHEGPQRISKRGGGVALAAGMILSNEPGYYRAGAYGIRIENLVEVVALPPLPDAAPEAANGSPWLAFETLTLVPIDTRLVDITLLSIEERNWLNAYHRRVFHALEPALEPETRAWLRRATQAV